MPCCLIVDPYKFSQAYVEYLNLKGWDCIHLQSTPSPIVVMQPSSTYREQDYLASFIFNGKLEQLYKQLDPYKIDYVMAGSEPGVELADRLTAHFHTPGNSLAKSQARRDKFLMIETLSAAGVPSVKYFKSSHYAAILEWVHNHRSWPVVLKPLRSAATDDIYICHSEEKLQQAFNKIYGKRNVLGLINAEILVQAFLKGTEYVVNTVSLNGQHYVSDMWRCTKRYVEEVGTVIYSREQLLAGQGELQEVLTHYLEKVLAALEIVHGPGHAEIMITEDGPILIEIGARIGGLVNTEVHSLCLSHNQIELAIDAIADHPAFLTKTRKHYQLRKQASIILLAAYQEGIVKTVPILDDIQALTSFFSAHLNVKPGEKLVKTKDLTTAAGKVYLVHDDAEVIERDYQTLMTAEPHGFTTR